MNADVHTLAIVLTLTNLLEVIALIGQYRTAKTSSGLGWWAVGNAACALGFLFNYLRDAPAVGTGAIVATNAVFVAGLTFLYIGVLRFLGQRERRGRLIAFCTAFTLCIMYFTGVHDDLSARLVVMSFALAAMSFLIVRALLRHKTASVEESADFLALVFSAHGAFFAVRGVVLLFGAPVEAMFAPSVIQTATYLVALTTTTLWTFGFIILVNQRLTAKSREDKERFELIFNAGPDAAVLTRMDDDVFVDINDGFTTLTGLTRSAVVGKPVEAVPVWLETAQWTKFKAELEGGAAPSMDVVFRCSDGGEMSCMLSGKIMQLLGAPHVMTVARDITVRKRSEEALRESEEKYKALTQALEETNRKLEALTTTDPLTGISNRRHFDEVLAQEYARHARSGAPISLIMLDIDHFKAFNDRYGHVGGDACLRVVAEAIAACAVRPADVAARYGGEEFACILPETDHGGALRVAERIREAIWRLAIPHEGSRVAERVTASLGVATVRCGAGADPLALMVRADEQLYIAKSLGRNRIAGSGGGRQVEGASAGVQLLWTEALRCGNDLLDAQHKALFLNANNLLQLITDDSPSEGIGAALGILLEEVSRHFEDEDALLESLAFSKREEHAREHAELLQKGRDLLRQYQGGTVAVGEIILFLMHEVIMQHLLEGDAEFFPLTGRAPAEPIAA